MKMYKLNRLIKSRHAKRNRSNWLTRNLLGVTVSLAVVLGIVGNVLFYFVF